MASLHFTIPGRPTAWQRSVTSKGVRYTPPDMRAAQKAIGQLARIAMGPMQPMTGPLRLEVLAVYAIPKSWKPAQQEAAREGRIWKAGVPDIDNIAKQILDSLNGIAYGDDAQVVQLSAGKLYGSPERTEVRVTILDAPLGAVIKARNSKTGPGKNLVMRG